MSLMTCHLPMSDADLAAAEAAALAELNHCSRLIAAYVLLDEIAGRLDVDYELAREVLQSVPENLLTLLDSPQGWIGLMGVVSLELGIVCPDYRPSVH
jgi:hypothetical protein